MAEDAGSQAQSPAVSLAPHAVFPRQQAPTGGDDPRPTSSSAWLATAGVQALGTLVGLVIGLPAGAAALWFVLRRLGSEAPAPVIRLEIANPPFSTSPVPSISVTAEGVNKPRPRPEAAEGTVPVVDFRDQRIALATLGKTYDDEQRAEAEQCGQREEEILRRIVAENVAFREEMCRRVPAA